MDYNKEMPKQGCSKLMPRQDWIKAMSEPGCS